MQPDKCEMDEMAELIRLTKLIVGPTLDRFRLLYQNEWVDVGDDETREEES